MQETSKKSKPRNLKKRRVRSRSYSTISINPSEALDRSTAPKATKPIKIQLFGTGNPVDGVLNSIPVAATIKGLLNNVDLQKP